MSKFTAYYNLCSIHDPKEFLGLSNDSEEGNIIVTLGRNIVKIIKLSTQNLIRNWTTQDKLLLKVVFDKKSEQYVGVFCGRYLRCWNADTTDINKVKKIKFQKEIQEIVSSDILDEVLLIYNDGSCESLSSGIESRKDISNITSTTTTATTKSTNILDAQNQIILNANVFMLRDGRKLLTYFLKNQKDNESIVQLVTVFLNEENYKSLQTIKYQLNRQGVNLSGYTVVDGQYYPMLLTIWSDKRIFIMPLKDNVQPEDAPGNFISMLTIFKVDTPISIIGISTNCIAIYGANTSQEGASLVLYNTQFKVVKSKQFFKIYFDFSRLWVADNHILLAMGQNLSVVKYRVSKEHLSELVGSQISNDLNGLEISYDFINEEDDIEEVINLASLEIVENSENKFEEIEMNDDDIIADGKNVPYMPFDVFDNDYRYVCNYKNLNVEIIPIDDLDENDIQIELMTNYNDKGFITKDVEILAKALEKSGASEQEITEKLLFILINAKKIDDIINCLRRYTYISERALSKVLKYALTDFQPKLITDKENESNYKQSSSNAISDDKLKLLNIIISCSFNVESFSTYIRKELDFDQVFILIQHLYNIMSNPDNLLEERPETSIDFDEDFIILRWMNVILNTHFQQLALSRDLKLMNLLKNWLEALNEFRKDLIDLCDLSYLLYQLVDGKLGFKEKPYSKWYSIEEVKLY